MLSDFRPALRSLLKSKILTWTCVVSLALGIGAATAVFSAVDTIVLNPFPYKDSHEIYNVVIQDPNRPNPIQTQPVAHFEAIRERTRSFEILAGGNLADINVTFDGIPRFLRSSYVTIDLFPVLGVAPLKGRIFSQPDLDPSSPSTCVLSHTAWQTHFGGRADIVGHQFRANGLSRTIIGVMPPRFAWRSVDLYLLHNPRGVDPEPVRSFSILGRLKPGTTREQAEADLAPVIDDLRQINPTALPKGARARLQSFHKTYGSTLSDHFWALLGGVGLLLLTACVNVSCLLIAKGIETQKDISIRQALGASNASILRLRLVESLLLSAFGTVAGVGLAFLLVHLTRNVLPPDMIPAEVELRVSPKALLLSVALMICTAFAFGLAPAVAAVRTSISNVLRESGRALTPTSARRSLRTSLTILEIALAVMLLSGAGVLLESLLRLSTTDLGYDASRVAGFRLPINEMRYPDRARRQQLFDNIHAQLSSIPGVNRVSMSTSVHPYSDFTMHASTPGGPQDGMPIAQIRQIGEDYPAMFGSRLAAGRFFTTAELRNRTPVALINQTTARLFFAGADPLGKQITIPALGQKPYASPMYNAEGVDTFQIVGVVADRANQGIHKDTAPEIAIPSSIVCVPSVVMIESNGSTSPNALLRTAHERILKLDPELALSRPGAANQIFDEFYVAGPRLIAGLALIFSIAGLLLAAIGLYGVIAANVASRVPEFGIRLALGAQPSDVQRMVLSGGLRLLAAGVSIGLIGALVAMRYLSAILYKTSPWEPRPYLAVILTLAVVGLLAAWRPARRATRIDPMQALREF